MNHTICFSVLVLGTSCWLSSARVLAAPPHNFPMLPDAIANFGAAQHDGRIYVYGGHQGQQEQLRAKNLSRHFVRCRFGSATEWEELPVDKPLQDLALVSCIDRLYLIGGTAARDARDTESPLQSVADFVRFDPETKEWTPLSPLPSPRSAHDAIAAEGKIYVVGGWHVEGDAVRDWHDSALVYDTTAGAAATWESLPIPSFRRRNLAVTTWQNCIWAIGGKDDLDQGARTAFYYDPQRDYWSEGPELPTRANGLQGYGVAAWGLESGLYVCGADGVVYQLTDLSGDWHPVAHLRVPRYCHRLLPNGHTALLALAGHSISFGPTRNIEQIKLYSP